MSVYGDKACEVILFDEQGQQQGRLGSDLPSEVILPIGLLQSNYCRVELERCIGMIFRRDRMKVL